jgi:predicted cupin superfamily sugar epimerase
MNARARSLIDRLALGPHPEGGHFRQVYRSPATVQPSDERPVRASLTTIYFLLAAGEISRWHRVRSDEVWHFYEGDPIELFVADPVMRAVDRVLLGELSHSATPVHAVAPSRWQAARPTGEYGLVGCTVAPGFDFADFAFLRDDHDALRALQSLDPALAALA